MCTTFVKIALLLLLTEHQNNHSACKQENMSVVSDGTTCGHRSSCRAADRHRCW